MEKAREFQKNTYFCFLDYAKAFDSVDHNKLWKILKEMGIPDHLTCLLRNLYAGQEATVRTGHGTTDWFRIGKRVCQGCILSPCLLNLYAEYIMWNVRLDEAQAKIKVLGEIPITSDIRWYQTYCRKQRTKEPLDESERGEWNNRLKTQHSENQDHGIWSHHFMANRWRNNGNSDRLFWGATKLLHVVTSFMILKNAGSLEKKLWPT